MLKNDCLIALRIPGSTKDALEELMVLRDERNQSAFLRSVVEEYIQNNLPEKRDALPESKEVTVKLNERAFLLLKRLISLGIITTMAEGIREAIPQYCGRKMDEYTEVESLLKAQEGQGDRHLKQGTFISSPFEGGR